MKARPDLWYNAYDGMKIGTNIEGHYLKTHHKIKGNFWINSGMFRDDNLNDGQNDKISYRIKQYLTKINLKKNNYKNLLFSLDPKRVLERGYSIALKNNGSVIRSAEEISFGEKFKLQTGNGSFEAEKINNLKNK